MSELAQPPLQLDVAIDDYWHTQALFDRRVEIDGISLTHVPLAPPQIFARLSTGAPWALAEMSMGKMVAMRARYTGDFLALPVFPHRVFRHAAFYIRADSTLTVDQLDGKRIGVPDWTLSAAIYARALLTHQYGIALERISWVQAGVDTPRRASPTPALPPGITLHEASGTTLMRLLTDGAIDAMITPHAPAAALGKPAAPPPFKHLFDDFAQRDYAYWQTTGLFPIMHAVVLKRDIEARRPGTAEALIRAFGAARDVALQRLADPAESALPVPFLADHIARVRRQFDAQSWPYGIEPNRPTLSAFLAYCHEQGICDRHLTPEELFA